MQTGKWAVIKILPDYPNLPMVTLYDTHEEAVKRVETYKGLEPVTLYTVVYAPHNDEIVKMLEDAEEV